jgi:hypothetical protein
VVEVWTRGNDRRSTDEEENAGYYSHMVKRSRDVRKQIPGTSGSSPAVCPQKNSNDYFSSLGRGLRARIKSVRDKRHIAADIPTGPGRAQAAWLGKSGALLCTECSQRANGVVNGHWAAAAAAEAEAAEERRSNGRTSWLSPLSLSLSFAVAAKSRSKRPLTTGDTTDDAKLPPVARFCFCCWCCCACGLLPAACVPYDCFARYAGMARTQNDLRDVDVPDPVIGMPRGLNRGTRNAHNGPGHSDRRARIDRLEWMLLRPRDGCPARCHNHGRRWATAGKEVVHRYVCRDLNST